MPVVLLVLSACGGSGSSSSSTASSGTTAAGSSSGSAPANKANLALFIVIRANPYAAAQIKGVQDEARKLGASVTVFDAQLDPQKQISQCNDAIATGRYNGFLISPAAGPTMMPCVRQAIAKGIKVAALSDPIGPEQTLKPQIPGLTATVAKIGPTAGPLLAEMAGKACAGKQPCKTAYLIASKQGTYSLGLFDAFKKAAPDNIDLVFEGETQFTPDLASKLVKDLLVKQPDINLIVSDADPATLGVVKALGDKAGRSVAVVSSSGQSLLMPAIKAGQVYGTFALHPQSEGRVGTEAVVNAIQGKPVPRSEVNEVTDLVQDGVGPIITKANVDQFKPEF